MDSPTASSQASLSARPLALAFGSCSFPYTFRPRGCNCNPKVTPHPSNSHFLFLFSLCFSVLFSFVLSSFTQTHRRSRQHEQLAVQRHVDLLPGYSKLIQSQLKLLLRLGSQPLVGKTFFFSCWCHPLFHRSKTTPNVWYKFSETALSILFLPLSILNSCQASQLGVRKMPWDLSSSPRVREFSALVAIKEKIHIFPTSTKVGSKFGS
ncbi:PREDICTED: putative uncharacterized protein DKFZp434L187 [Cercocebus atys]|uniref:putative uncharacterized protein DKFZp434L187 n=1 Tax=Cercocebus atys TaxID=9531 RepID=UPI0005F47929|nr:PREDICTED: putative uncharacterized protein DKFZp434L187 [Cercocebus atys]